MRRYAIVGLGVLALAACQKKAQEADPAAEQAGKAATAGASAGLGMRKAGLWSQTVNADGHTQTMKICFDAANLEDAEFSGDVTKDKCSEHTVTPAPGGWSFKSVCDLGPGGHIVSTGTATGGGDGYKVDVTTVTTDAAMPQANGTHQAAIEAKWEGPCPAGMKPGDIDLPGGMRINPQTMAGRAPK